MVDLERTRKNNYHWNLAGGHSYRGLAGAEASGKGESHYQTLDEQTEHRD